MDNVRQKICSHKSEAKYINILSKNENDLYISNCCEKDGCDSNYLFLLKDFENGQLDSDSTTQNVCWVKEKVSEEIGFYNTYINTFKSLIQIINENIKHLEKERDSVSQKSTSLDDIFESKELCKCMHSIWKIKNDFSAFTNYKNSIKNFIKSKIQLENSISKIENDHKEKTKEFENKKEKYLLFVSLFQENISKLISETNIPFELDKNLPIQSNKIVKESKEMNIPEELEIIESSDDQESDNFEEFHLKILSSQSLFRCKKIIREPCPSLFESIIIFLPNEECYLTIEPFEKSFLGTSFTLFDYNGIKYQNFVYSFGDNIPIYNFVCDKKKNINYLSVFCNKYFYKFMFDSNFIEIPEISELKFTGTIKSFQYFKEFSTFTFSIDNKVLNLYDSSFNCKHSQDIDLGTKDIKYMKMYDEKTVVLSIEAGLMFVSLKDCISIKMFFFEKLTWFGCISQKNLVIIFENINDFYTVGYKIHFYGYTQNQENWQISLKCLHTIEKSTFGIPERILLNRYLVKFDGINLKIFDCETYIEGVKRIFRMGSFEAKIFIVDESQSLFAISKYPGVYSSDPKRLFLFEM